MTGRWFWARQAFRAVALVFVSIVAVLHVAQASDASLSARFDPYLHRPNGAMADPINLSFVGGTPGDAAAAMRSVLGWTDVSGSELDFLNSGQPLLSSIQLGYDLGHGDRYHIRIDRAGEPGRPYVFAGVHHDLRRACGHVGGSFNQVRDLVAGAFARAGYSVSSIPLGNNKPSRQCDGSFSSGDGMAAVIDLASH